MLDAQQKISLWIIEDDQAQSDLVSFLVKQIDPAIQVEVFISGQEFLDRIQSSKPPSDSKVVVLSDQNLSDMSGIEVLATLRKNSPFSEAPFILFSGTIDPKVREQIYSFGGTAYLVKPFELDALKSFLSALISFWSWT